VTMAAFFSVAGMFHRYYLVMLTPAIAALVGIGAVALWKDYRSPGWRGWLLPLTLVGAAAVQVYILSNYEGWLLWLAPGISGLCLVAAGVLAIARLRERQEVRTSLLVGATAVGVLTLLVAPSVWASYNVLQGGGGGGGMAAAGPRPAESGGSGGGPPPGGGPGGPGGGDANSALVEYLQANKGDAEYLVAAASAMRASSLILDTDEKVIDLNGFEGHDPVFSADELTELADEGAVRYFLTGGGPGSENESTSWIEDNCEQVPEEEWQSLEAQEEQGGPPGGEQALYDCSVVGG
jgi:4-amino-4-deoxy-L-arabinose transferase-like glycosyltransferase